jgi:hypothetical protein
MAPALILRRLPQAERPAAIHVQNTLYSLDSYLNNFDHALTLFQESKAQTAALADKISERHQLLQGWMLMAARHASLSVYHFRSALHSIIKNVNEADTLRTAVDMKALEQAKDEFEKKFPRIIALRHAIAHEADNAFTADHVAKHSVKIGGTNFMLGGTLSSDIFKFTNGGVEVSLPVNGRSLIELRDTQLRFYGAFAAITWGIAN